MTKIYLSVTNDVANDQRVGRIASTLADTGLEVCVVGVNRGRKHNFGHLKYRVTLLNLPFQKGAMFYACYNIWLFFYLLFNKCNVVTANDLDSLPANYLISKIKQIPLIYDSHELFTEVPELVNRPKVKKVWEQIEKIIVPHLKYCYTVCTSIAHIYYKKYNVSFAVVRNVPFRKTLTTQVNIRPEWQEKKLIIYQGALNMGRGIEEAIAAMPFTNNVCLLIAGSGYYEQVLKEKVEQLKINDKVFFLGSLSPSDLHKYTCAAHLGFSLEQNMGLNYYYALPNKLFDYIQAEVPVLVSDFPEMASIVNQYEIGQTINDKNPEALAASFNEMLFNESKRAMWKANLKKAAEELCWENEKDTLLAVYKDAGVIVNDG